MARNSESQRPTSKARAAVFIKAAMEAMREAGGSLPLRDIKRAVAEKVTLDEHDLARYEKTGYVRWESVLHFYSIDAVKAGFIRKQAGRWHLTPEGEAALKLPAPELLEQAVRLYREWKVAQSGDNPIAQTAPARATDDEPPVDRTERAFVLETAQSEARAEIEEFVRKLGPYEFQDLVGALLRGMGYTTRVIAQRGPDGGTDILAYPDPLGARTPHIRVQVKHRNEEKAKREEIAALRGIIRQDREIGLFVSTAGFTSSAVSEARNGAIHIELMDLTEMLDSWVSHYASLSEEDRGRLRLQPVYFLAPS